MSDSYFSDLPKFHRGKVAAAGGTLFLLLIVLIIMFSCGKPRQGTILYGICNTFLEQNIAYPEVVQRKKVEQYPRGVRIYYAQIDPFGQNRSEMIECAFIKNEQGQIILEDVFINREEVAREIIDKFNPTIPIIAAAEPNLDLPPRQPDIEIQLRGARRN